MRVWVITWGCHSVVRNTEHCKCSKHLFFSSYRSAPVPSWRSKPLCCRLGESINQYAERDICNLGLAKLWLRNFKLSKVMNETFITSLWNICTHAMWLQLFIASSEMQLGGNPPEILLTQLFEEAFSLNLNAGDHYFLGFGSEHTLWTTKLAFWKHYHCLIKPEHNPRVSSKGVLLSIFD